MLPKGFSIPVTFSKPVSSNNTEEVVAVVANDITDSEGNKLIAAGTPVQTSTTKTVSAVMGNGGNMELTFKSTLALDGQQIFLSGTHSVKGKNRKIICTGAAIAGLGLFIGTTKKKEGTNELDPASVGIFGGLGLGMLVTAYLIKGKPAVIPQSTTFSNIYSASAYKIKITETKKTLTQQNNQEQNQYRGSGDPLKGLNVSKSKDMVIGNYYALIIGIDKYNGTWQQLKNAVQDAKAVEKLLKEKYKFDFFKTLYDQQATRENIIKAMEYLTANAKENDNVFIYYSGHGEFKKELNKGYWVPADAKTSTSTFDYVSNNDIQTFLAGIKSKHTLMVSDACFSGDIFRGNTISVPFEESERYYKDVHNLASRQALTSGGIEPVMDGGKDGHSVFAYYFMKALKENNNKFFDASQLYSTLKIPVTNNSEQTPEFQSIKNTGDEGGQFIFIKK